MMRILVEILYLSYLFVNAISGIISITNTLLRIDYNFEESYLCTQYYNTLPVLFTCSEDLPLKFTLT